MGVALLDETAMTTASIPVQSVPPAVREHTMRPTRYVSPDAIPTAIEEVYVPLDCRTRRTLGQRMVEYLRSENARRTNARKSRGRRPVPSRRRGDNAETMGRRLNQDRQLEDRTFRTEVRDALCGLPTDWRHAMDSEHSDDVPLAYLDGDVITREDLRQQAAPADERLDLDAELDCVGMRVLVLA